MENCEKCGTKKNLYDTNEIINIPNKKGQIRYIKTITHRYCGTCNLKFEYDHRHFPK